MIFIAGSSIFSGYLDASIESPFEVFNGVKYYKTGDLGYLDTDGFLHITGRLKRFIKIAGEMISLPSLEAILLEKYNQPDAPSLALEARDDQ
jgi:long-chain-fatty-acid--[acyl-carrier-protein] ligase